MCRNRHNSTGTITHQYIIGYKDRNLLTIYRIDCRHTVNLHTGLLFGKFSTFKIGFSGSLLAVSHYFIPVLQLCLILINNRMLRRNYHVSNAKQGITSGRINTKLILFSFDGKVHLCAGRFTDPVLLGYFNLLYIVYRIQTLNQLIRIFCNLKHPLALYLTDYLRTTTLTYTIYHFLIGKTNLTGRTPVDRHFRFIGKSCFKQF